MDGLRHKPAWGRCQAALPQWDRPWPLLPELPSGHGKGSSHLWPDALWPFRAAQPWQGPAPSGRSKDRGCLAPDFILTSQQPILAGGFALLGTSAGCPAQCPLWGLQGQPEAGNSTHILCAVGLEKQHSASQGPAAPLCADLGSWSCRDPGGAGRRPPRLALLEPLPYMTAAGRARLGLWSRLALLA